MATRPLFGDAAANAKVWSKYAVLLGGLTATTPTDNAAFTLNDPPTTTTQWDPVGELSPDTPFSEGEESITSQDHTGANAGVYAQTFTSQKETISFTAKETTLITLGIVYDSSGLTEASGEISGTLKQRDPLKRYKVGFHRQNGTEIERRITKQWATVESVQRQSSNNEATYTVTLLIAPDSSGNLYDYYLGPIA